MVAPRTAVTGMSTRLAEPCPIAVILPTCKIDGQRGDFHRGMAAV
jgi:hypothetical protein